MVTTLINIDQPFACVDCGKAEVWTEAQQKRWCEIAKGNVWTIAQSCHSCRRRARDRRLEAQHVQREGAACKQQSPFKPGQLPKTERNQRAHKTTSIDNSRLSPAATRSGG